MSKSKTERAKLPFDIAIAQMTELALQLPLNHDEQCEGFEGMLKILHATPAGTDYLRRIDRAKALSDKERLVLTDEGKGYLLALAMYYILQMADWTTWSSNIGERVVQSKTYSFVTERAMLTTLFDLGWYDKAKREKENVRLCRRRQGYIKRYTIKRVYTVDHSFSPLFRELLLNNVGKRIELTPAKVELVIKYAAKIHKVARAYYKNVYKNYSLVGINYIASRSIIEI